MPKVDILQKGNIYFFYRPKVQHEEAHGLEEIQRFFIVLKPDSSPLYILLIVGKKYMPEGKGHPFFAFVDHVTRHLDKLIAALSAQHYDTSTRGKRELPPTRCIAEGKYILALHNRHTHLTYQLKTPSKKGEVQEEFGLSEKGDYIMSVKNPYLPSQPAVGLDSQQKADYPDELKGKLNNHRFIPLNPSSFLNYEGAELLLISKGGSDLSQKEPDIEKCLSHIPDDQLMKKFKDIQEPESLMPLLEKKWK